MTDSKSRDLDITLYRGWSDTCRYVWSPFVTKLELRLRLSNLPYRTAAGSMKTAPTGKIPYVELRPADQPTPTTTIGDSALIAQYFTKRGLINDLDAGLGAASRAQDLAVRALMEDRLYFFNMRERWIDNFYTQRDQVLVDLFWPLRVGVGAMIYRSHMKTLYGQGTGRYSAAEARSFQEEIWTRVDELLGERRKGAVDGGCFWCLGGEQPTECDTSVFGFVCSVLVAKSSPESARFVKGLPAVMDYAKRIHERYFPDYEMWDVTDA